MHLDPMTNNYDQEELNKFEALASHWWDEQGELKTLHQINSIRSSYIASKLNLCDKFLIDVGCGGGLLAESMAKLSANVTGIDINQSLIDVAKLHQLESGTKVQYIKATAEEFTKERPEYYDVLTCLEMLEHVPDPFSVILACSQLLKPGGHIFFSTLNRNPKSYLFAIIGAEYLLKLLPRNTHDYAKFIRPSELNHWANEAGFDLKEMKGITYHPFKKEFKLTDDIAVNYLFYAVKR